MAVTHISLNDLDYDLPSEKIAFFPLELRDKSKLLVYNNDEIIDSTFSNLFSFLDNNYALIFNDSRVIHARLILKNQNGASIEVFLLEPVYPSRDIATAFSQTEMVAWKCLVGNAKRFRDAIDFEVNINNDLTIKINAEKGDRVGDAFLVTFSWENSDISFAEWLEHFGKMPLPPYIKREANQEDEQRYQTIYAENNGSVAAPTAGLHFSVDIIQQLRNKKVAMANITLHVGAGTFKPISTETIDEHIMHQEQIVVSKDMIDFLLQKIDKKTIAVGTTVARTLESLFIMGSKLVLDLPNPFLVEQFEVYENKAISEVSVKDSLFALRAYFNENSISAIYGNTSLMIVPEYNIKMTRGIITNFHQPKSTLLLLIGAYLGENWKKVYKHALANDYRFLSYGDSNFYEL